MNQQLELNFKATKDSEAYPELPFELPPRVDRLEVSYTVEPAEAVVDLGILGPEGFRGYSGGARQEFFLELGRATPGYLPGPLTSGTWRVLLGLYRIPPEGAQVVVRIRYRQFSGWLKGDLHTHTCHSDARGTIDDLMSVARSRGLDFVAVTDHNTVSHHRPLLANDWGLIAIPGQEVTTFRGHFNVLGSLDWLDFRILDELRLRTILNLAGQRGGLRILNHPKPGGPAWEFDHWEDFEALEVWNGPWPRANQVALDRWHELLCSGRRLVATGGSDRHQPPLPDLDDPSAQVGSPCNRVWAEEASAEGVLLGVRRGRTSIAESPDGPFLSWWHDQTEISSGELQVGESLRLEVEGDSSRLRWRLLTEKGLLQEGEAARHELSFPDCLFLRAELYEPKDNRIVALSNPVYRS